MLRNCLRNHDHATKYRPQLELLEERATPATLLGLTTANKLIMFDSATPTKILHTVKISGLTGGEDIVSIDARPANGVVYGLSNQNNLFTINPFSGVVKKITADTPPPAFGLQGNRFGIDFNPNVDRLRIVSNADQNFRINPVTGAIVDGDAGTGGIQPDSPLTGTGNPNITEVAYDRNFQGTALTTLYGIDSTTNSLVTIGGIDGTPSPNLGQVINVGALGFNTGAQIGFDIADDGTAFAAFRPSNGKGAEVLYTVDLTSGAATAVGKVGNGKQTLDGLTALSREEVVYGVTVSNRLVSFRADNPGSLLSSVAIKGLIVGEKVTDIDFRPASGELFALSSINRVLRIDPATGQATQLGVPIVTSPQFTANSPGGMDFNPTVDLFRLVNVADDNLRFDPLTFAPRDSDANPANGITPDSDLVFDALDENAGDDPNIVGIAYDRNDNDDISPPNTGTATTLWGIDSLHDTLVTIGGPDATPSPNLGGVFTVGTSLDGENNLGVEVTDLVGFDIVDQGTLGVGAALAVMQVDGELTSKLFTINLNATGTTNQPQGSATLVGEVGGGELIQAMAIAPPSFQFSVANFSVQENKGSATITITRTGGSNITATVVLDTLDGTALAGSDYTAVTNQLITFNRGETTKTVSIPILNNNQKEPNETVQLSLSQAAGGNHELGDLANALLTILNDD